MARSNKNKKDLSSKIIANFKRIQRNRKAELVTEKMLLAEIEQKKAELENTRARLESIDLERNQAELEALGEFARLSGVSVFEILNAFNNKDFFSIQEKIEKNGNSPEMFREFFELFKEENTDNTTAQATENTGTAEAKTNAENISEEENEQEAEDTDGRNDADTDAENEDEFNI